MSGSGSTISNVAPAAGNLRVQTSVYGAVIPLIYGTARVSGNLLWFGGFVAIPHTSTTTSGGKGGGGVKQQNTTFTYQAAVMMSLGEGPINSVLSAWRGKRRYTGTPGAGLATYSETFTVPASGLLRVANGPGFQNNVQVADPRIEGFDNSSGGGG